MFGTWGNEAGIVTWNRCIWGDVEADHCVFFTRYSHKIHTITSTKENHPCLPRRQKVFTCSSVQQCWLLSGLCGPVHLALCFSGQLRLPVKGDRSLIRRAAASPQEQECFWCSWEGVKSSVPVSQHKMTFSKINASSVWGEGSMLWQYKKHFSLTHASSSFL